MGQGIRRATGRHGRPPSGTAHLQWAWAAAAVVCLRDHPAAQQDRPRVEQTHATGTARTIRAQQVARAVSERRKRQVAFARETCCPREGRVAAEPGVSLDTQGMHLPEALARAACPASVHATAPRGQKTLSPAPVLGPPRSLRLVPGLVANGRRVGRRPRVWLSLDQAPRCARPLHRPVGGHSDVSRSQRTPPTRRCTRRAGGARTSRRVWCRRVRSAPSSGHQVSAPDCLLTTPGIHRRKKSQKSAPRGRVSLDNRGPHTCSAPQGIECLTQTFGFLVMSLQAQRQT